MYNNLSNTINVTIILYLTKYPVLDQFFIPGHMQLQSVTLITKEVISILCSSSSEDVYIVTGSINKV